LALAECKAERSLLVIGAAFILIERPKVEFHLPLVARFDAAKFEID
jgi:hypothetical protein